MWSDIEYILLSTAGFSRIARTLTRVSYHKSAATFTHLDHLRAFWLWVSFGRFGSWSPSGVLALGLLRLLRALWLWVSFGRFGSHAHPPSTGGPWCLAPRCACGTGTGTALAEFPAPRRMGGTRLTFSAPWSTSGHRRFSFAAPTALGKPSHPYSACGMWCA